MIPENPDQHIDVVPGFDERVDRCRMMRALTWAQVGDRIGVTRATLWNWRVGNTRPRVRDLHALAALLGTTFEKLAWARSPCRVRALKNKEVLRDEPGRRH